MGGLICRHLRGGEGWRAIDVLDVRINIDRHYNEQEFRGGKTRGIDASSVGSALKGTDMQAFCGGEGGKARGARIYFLP